MPVLQPRDYQENARDQIVGKIDDGIRKVICYLPTGMGKTLIAIITLQHLVENEYLKPDDKVLFLVADRKLKHQLHDMASSAGLGNYGNLFILPEGQDYPAYLVRQHASMSRFIFATPVLFANAVIARSAATQKLDKSILQQIKVVIVDEVLDVLAQSYGKKRTKEETVDYIKKIFNVDDYDAFLQEMGQRYEIPPQQVELLLEKEFSPRYYRMNAAFEPVLNMLRVLDPKAEVIVIGLTASVTQQAKRDILVERLGGKEQVAEIQPAGEDYENYRPSITLKKIRVIDDEISKLDSFIQDLKSSALSTIKKAYKDATNNPDLPSDRILLFVTEFLAKKDLRDKVVARLKQRGMAQGEIDDTMKRYTTTSSAYLLLTVGRQKLLEDTIKAFYKFVKSVKNTFLTSSDAFKQIDALISARMDALQKDKSMLSEKDKKLIYWVNRLAVTEGKKILIMARFVNMVEHIHQILVDPANGGVPAVLVHGKMSGEQQHEQISKFKSSDDIKVLVASERLIEKGTDLPEADIAFYYGSTISLERYEQSLGRIRSTVLHEKTAYTISYNLTVEAEKSAKRDAAFIELLERGSKKGLVVSMGEGAE
ncbi:MAG: DEAD/DEAH box helicase family protein [Candidatus Lokiarchaeota archaeon]|nr:DEAD/DEAH box helicase family protein [Candidatus Lokiarchaeota archaeon]